MSLVRMSDHPLFRNSDSMLADADKTDAKPASHGQSFGVRRSTPPAPCRMAIIRNWD